LNSPGPRPIPLEIFNIYFLLLLLDFLNISNSTPAINDSYIEVVLNPFLNPSIELK